MGPAAYCHRVECRSQSPRRSQYPATSNDPRYDAGVPAAPKKNRRRYLQWRSIRGQPRCCHSENAHQATRNRRKPQNSCDQRRQTMRLSKDLLSMCATELNAKGQLLKLELCYQQPRRNSDDISHEIDQVVLGWSSRIAYDRHALLFNFARRQCDNAICEGNRKTVQCLPQRPQRGWKTNGVRHKI